MGIRRTAIWLFAWSALVIMANRALAQPAHSNLHYQVPHPTYENGPAPFSNDNPGPAHKLNPFHPVGFEPQFDWFAPAETSGYGRGPRPHIGYFFSYERLFWSLSAPKRASIGSENGPVNTLFPVFPPSVDNRWINAHGGWGNRWELGYTDTDDYGWLVSVLDHVSQSNYRIDETPWFSLGDPLGKLSGEVPFVVTDSDPTETVILNIGTLPFAFGEFRMQSHVRLNGVDLSRFYRARKLHNGSYFELLYGVRWFQIDDAMIVEADGNGLGTATFTVDPGVGFDPATFSIPINILDASIWSNRVLNNLVGPQIGVRFFRQRGRWVTSLSARFLAAANFQNILLRTSLGDQTILFQALSNNNVTTFFPGLGVDKERNVVTFAPMGELRVNVAWQATRNVGIKVGYTGMVVGGISRGSNTIDYDAGELIGILNGNNHQIFFVNGLNFGVEINR